MLLHHLQRLLYFYQLVWGVKLLLAGSDENVCEHCLSQGEAFVLSGGSGWTPGDAQEFGIHLHGAHSPFDSGREGELEVVRAAAGCVGVQEWQISSPTLLHAETLHPLLRNGLIIFNDFLRPFLYDFYCLCFICRCSDFCRSFSKWKLLFGSVRSFLVWNLFPVSVQRKGQQEGQRTMGSARISWWDQETLYSYLCDDVNVCRWHFQVL